MLKLNNVEVAYLNVIRVLHGISLNVEDGSVVALLGANGAGKTTTLKAISGLLHIEEGEVTDGSIEWNGERIDRKSGYCPSTGGAKGLRPSYHRGESFGWCL